jgi:hypothetical protein
MAVKAAVAVGALPTSNGSYTDFTVADFGTVDAAIIFVSNANTTNNPQATTQLSVGFWTSAAQSAVCVTSGDASATGLTGRKDSSSDVVLAITSSDSGSTWSILTECSAQSIANGIRITKDSGSSSVARYATVVLLSGLTNKAVGSVNLGTGTSAVNVTAPGFRADLVFLACIGAAAGASQSQAIFSFGAAQISATDTVSQGAVFVGSEHGVEVSNTYSMLRSDCAVGQFYQNAITWRASVSANANGFAVTPNASASSDVAYYLAIELPDPEDAYVGIVDSKTSTGTQAYTGTGFTPQALILAQTLATAVNTTINDGFLALGAGGPVTTERCLDYTDEDAQADTDAESEADLSNILHIKTGDGADDAIAALDSFDSDGWTLNYSDGSASARKILAIAIGDSSTGGAVTVAPTTGHLTFSGKTPTVTRSNHRVVAPSTGHVVLAGKTPTVTRSNHRVVAPSAGHLTYTGRQPTISQGLTTTVSPSTGHVTLAGKTPTITQTAHRLVSPSTGHVVLTGRQPTIVRSDHRAVAPSTGHLTYAGKTPLVSQAFTTTVAPSTGHVVLGGHAPVVTQTDHHVLAPATGHIVYAGKVPTVVVPTTPSTCDPTEIWAHEIAPGVTAGSALAALTTADIASAVLVALQATTIPVDVRRINDTALTGSGVTGDEWGPA